MSSDGPNPGIHGVPTDQLTCTARAVLGGPMEAYLTGPVRASTPLDAAAKIGTTCAKCAASACRAGILALIEQGIPAETARTTMLEAVEVMLANLDENPEGDHFEMRTTRLPKTG